MKPLIRSLALVLPWALASSPAASAESLQPRPRVVAEGRVAPYPGAEVTLALDLAGTLQGVSVEEKQVVRKGSVVARLRVDDLKAALAEAKARIAETEADVRLYELEVERAERLVADRVESVQNADRARRNRDAGKARLATAEAAVRRLEAEIAKSILISPIGGVVTEKLVDTGESVRAGQAILTVVDLGRLRIEAEVDEFDASRVHVGTSVVVTAEGYPGSWRAKVEEIPDTVARRSVRPQDPGKPEDTRVLRVKIAFEEPTPLRLGQRVEVAIGG
jgi:RND family efflux transporter MFP subunit